MSSPDLFVNLWGSMWVRASHVVSVVGAIDADGLSDGSPTVYVRMSDGTVHSNLFADISMDIDGFVEALVGRLAGEGVEGEG